VGDRLNYPELFKDFDRYARTLEEHGELQRLVGELNERWEALARELEEQEPPPDAPAERPAAPQRARLLARLHELERQLEDPAVYGASEAHGRALMDEYAEVYEALAALPADGAASAGAGSDGEGRGAETERVRARLAELERRLMDPELFLDEARSASVVEEYGRLQETLQRLSAPAGRA
jgi:protein subunit release factor A